MGLIITGIIFLFYSFARLENEFYLDTISAFLSSVIFLIVGFTAYGGIQNNGMNIQYPVIGLLFVVLGIIAALLGILHVFDIAINEFGAYDDETDRGADYEYV